MGTLFVGGCATPRDFTPDRPALAEVVGVSPENVLFMGYCHFAAGKTTDQKLNFNPGMLVVTSEAVFLLRRDIDTISHEWEIKIPYAEMKGVDLKHFGRGRQLQILCQERLVVFGLTTDMHWVDQKGSEDVLRLLTERGVGSWQSERFYQ